MRKVFLASLSVAVLAVSLVYTPKNDAARAAEAGELESYFPIDMEDHWAYYELDDFVNADLLKGYKNGRGDYELKPDSPITRAEFVALLVRALGLASDKEGLRFDDVKANEWYYEPVRIASSLGIVTGKSETSFDPKQTISRADIAVMVVRAFKETIEMPARIDADQMPYTDVSRNYAWLPIGQASIRGIVNGKTDTAFKPNDKAKRAEAAVMLSRALSLQIHFNTGSDILYSVIHKSDQAEYKTIGEGAYDQLADVMEPYFTGYYWAAHQQYANDVSSLVAQGVDIAMEEVSPRILTTLASSDRFVVIQSTGGRYKLTTTEGQRQTTETLLNDGIFMLKKMLDGKWKIYAYYPAEEQ